MVCNCCAILLILYLLCYLVDIVCICHAPEPVEMGVENLVPTGIRSPGPSSPQRVAITTIPPQNTVANKNIMTCKTIKGKM
jgi:hypothetical protein